MTKEAWIEEAHSWVGTPFRWQGRTKGSGSDCWGIIVAGAHNLGYIPKDWDVRQYDRRTDIVALSREHLPRWFDRVEPEDLQAGDIAIFRRREHGILHMAILYDHPYGGLGMIHSDDWDQIRAHAMPEDTRSKIREGWRPRYEQE